MLSVKDFEMGKSYKKHYAAYRYLDGSNHKNECYTCGLLALFYSVECGLKYAIMRSRALQLWNGSEINLSSGHSLLELKKELKIFGPEYDLQLPKIKGNCIKDGQLQEVWRYSVSTDSYSDMNATNREILLNYVQWIEGNV